jgi:hypothetical protein
VRGVIPSKYVNVVAGTRMLAPCRLASRGAPLMWSGWPWVAVTDVKRCSEQWRQIVGDGGYSGIDDNQAAIVPGDDVAVEAPPRHPSDRASGTSSTTSTRPAYNEPNGTSETLRPSVSTKGELLPTKQHSTSLSRRTDVTRLTRGSAEHGDVAIGLHVAAHPIRILRPDALAVDALGRGPAGIHA